jgi:hypothetical protein
MDAHSHKESLAMDFNTFTQRISDWINALDPTVAIAVLVAVAAGVALLAWALVRSHRRANAPVEGARDMREQPSVPLEGRAPLEARPAAIPTRASEPVL